MIKISHRGNLDGPKLESENHPAQIKKALSKSYHCEADVWYVNGHFSLGHDKPTYPIDKTFLENEKIWCHAKNLPALESMLYYGIHCFWHETDKFTITSKGYIWTFPEEEVTKNSVIVHKGSDWKEKNYNCAAVCTDYIL